MIAFVGLLSPLYFTLFLLLLFDPSLCISFTQATWYYLRLISKRIEQTFFFFFTFYYFVTRIGTADRVVYSLDCLFEGSFIGQVLWSLRVEL